jgi:radical SAM enzyme (TIGR01210 family)
MNDCADAGHGPITDGGSGSSRNLVISRLTTRAWRDDGFRALLFDDPRTAMTMEFGAVPVGFEEAVFRSRAVDRVIARHTPDGKRVLVRPKRGDEPLSVVVRQVFGLPELVVVFYTKRCRYQCSFCTLPSTSAYSDVPFDDVKAQFDRALEFAGPDLPSIGQVSLGNEGSILDDRTFPRPQLEHVLRTCSRLPAIQHVVLETRGEFVSEQVLDDGLTATAPSRLTLKIGLESADPDIRNRVLRKRMDLGQFESVVRLLGRKGVGLASYVVVKADPDHSDADGRADAIATCEYLKALCRDSGTRLTLRVNTMYRAANSAWATWADQRGWTPPSIFDLAEVMRAVVDDDVQVYAGLSEEGLATADGHYEARDDFRPWARAALERYNQTGNRALLDTVADHRRSERGPLNQLG